MLKKLEFYIFSTFSGVQFVQAMFSLPRIVMIDSELR